MVPHLFVERYWNQLTSSEICFFIVLLKLENRFADSDGWFWHEDKEFTTNDGEVHRGFEIYGLSASTCKRARKKLTSLDLIKTKPGWYKNGHRSGTYYKINHKLLNDRVQNEPPMV